MIKTGIKTTLHQLYRLGIALQTHIDSGIEFYDSVSVNHLIDETLKRVRARILHKLANEQQKGARPSKVVNFRMTTAESEIIAEFIGGQEIFKMMLKNLSNKFLI